MTENIVDAKNCVLGRVASIVAERLLKGEKIVIINAEQAIINGSKETIVKAYKRRINLHAKGNPEKGPKFAKRRADMLFRQAVKGMLPQKTKRAKEALKNCQVFIGVPSEFREKEHEKIKNSEMRERKRFMSLEQLSSIL